MKDFYKGLLIIVLITLNLAFANGQSEELNIINILKKDWVQKSFPSSDLSSLKITDSYTDDQNGLTYIYIQQYLGDIPIESALGNLILKKDHPLYINTNRFIVDIHKKVTATDNIITGVEAATVAIIRSGATSYLRSRPTVLKEISPNHLIIKKSDNLLEDIPTQLIYKEDQGILKQYWKVGVHESSGDYWENYIDVQTGNITVRNNLTVACGSEPQHSPGANLPSPTFNPGFIKQYRVWPIPLSAPNAGPSQLIADPSDADASPMGWHDDGTTTYTITRGNNTHAFADPDSNYLSAGDEPTGGASLIFDYPYNPNGTIAQNKNAGVVNLFYMNNVMHDFAYHYGFTEQAGNFQTKNFSGKGKGNDAVTALAQFGANGSRLRNNADFLPPVDGTNGRMRMFVWNQTGTKLLKVIAPANLATGFETGSAEFGPAVSTTPITGKLTIVSDGTSNATFGCKPLVNAAEVSGKIALIDRGDCFFHEKACNAQAAGALAVIVCNFENTPMGMAAIASPPCNVTIPVISLGSVDCAFLKKNIQTITITLQKPASTSALEQDGSFDNGIIAHEYGHGISTRLTGGPGNSNCLSNDEQMGEGWSDFFTLVTTIQAGDIATTAKGIGTFPLQQSISDRGIRRFPYSTDLNINNLTYEDVFTTETPHSLGETWAAMLWDLYWAFSNAQGWDADLYKGKGGNNKAIRLVFEGLRLQPCGPGFVDGRNAILKADELLYNGENKCLIWAAFAKRGLGFSAQQGSSDNRSDGVEAFDLPPGCVPTVKIQKSVTPLINAGEDISVTIVARNDTKSSLANVTIKDIIPSGAGYKTNSSTIPLEQNGNILSLKINQLAAGDTMTFQYKLVSSKTLFSKTFFIDSMETTEFNYDVFSLQGSGIWELSDIVARSGKKAWFVPDLGTENDQLLQTLRPFDIKGLSQPVIRFYQRYNTQHAFDGGTVKASINDGLTYDDLGSKIFRNGYNGPLSYFALPILNQRAFYGDSKTFIPSFIDLADYKNTPFQLQFRFGSDDSQGKTGWWIDDLEIFDMFNYNSQACISYDGGIDVCAEAPAKGTIVESQFVTGTKDQSYLPINLSISPNPANDRLTIITNIPTAGQMQGEVYTIDGKLLRSFKNYVSANLSRTQLETTALPVGMYILRVRVGKYLGEEKFVIQR
ncbi:MAG: M36 family metallopeptidase [Saprospiraceae bacterium]